MRISCFYVSDNFLSENKNGHIYRWCISNAELALGRQHEIEYLPCGEANDTEKLLNLHITHCNFMPHYFFYCL